MSRSLVLLVVSANRAQAKSIHACVGKLSLSYDCHFVSSGRRAIDFLRQTKAFEGPPRPDLILLVSGPSGDRGRDVLRSVKSGPDFCSIPLIVASGQDSLQELGKTPEYQGVTSPPENTFGLGISLGNRSLLGQRRVNAGMTEAHGSFVKCALESAPQVLEMQRRNGGYDLAVS